MAKARDEGDWLRVSLLAVPMWNQVRDTKANPFPYKLTDFYPWPNQIPEAIREKIKPSELFKR